MEIPPAPRGTVDEAARDRTLLEINNAVVSNLTQDGLFHAIAQALRRVVPFERTAIFLHDPDRNVLRLFVLESSLRSSYFVVGLEMEPGESHVGWVFEHQRPLLRRDLATERQYPMEDRAFEDGVRSYVIVPLLVRGRPIGVLAVASVTTNRSSESDAVFLQDAANQIALAVENMKAYEAITALHREVQAEAALRRRAEEALRAVVEGTASVTGNEFFPTLVRHLASALGIRYAFVAECREEDKGRARTLAFWKGEGFGENFAYAVAGTPCRKVLDGEPGVYCEDLQRFFADDRELVELRAEMVYLQEEIRTQHNATEMVGSSPPLLGVLRKVEQVASTDATELISSE